MSEFAQNQSEMSHTQSAFHTQSITPELNQSYNPTLCEQLLVDPKLAWLQSGGWKAINLFRSIKEDVTDADIGSSVPVIGPILAPAIPVASAAMTGSTQTLDRIRIVVQEAPPRAIDAMTAMDFSRPSTLATAGIVAGSFAVWNFFAGEVLNRTIEKFPKTTETFIDTFPRATKAAEYAIPEELRTFNEQRANGTANKNGAGHKLRRGLKRGLNGFSFGSTIQIGVSAKNGIPSHERTKINAEVSRDAAVVTMVPLAGGIGEYVRRAAISGDPERAATVLSWAENKTNWNWVAVGIIAVTVGGNYIARRRVDSKLQNNEIEEPVAELSQDSLD